MRILHVATLVSPDGAFGGPVRVASNQCAALREAGYDVRIAAGSRGFSGPAPSELDGTPLHSFPARMVLPGVGFSALTSPRMIRWLQRAIPSADVVHVHVARDLVTLPAALIARRHGIPYVLQPHGMIVDSDSPLAPPLDAAVTRRVLRGAARVFHLTPEERAGLLGVEPTLRLEQLGNGVPAPELVPPLPERREVLYCARLQRRKRPALFATMARQLLAEGVDAGFALVGPDEGEGDAVATHVAAVGDEARLRWEGALSPDRTLARMAAASIVVLPSVHEPYPMSVLEAMSIGRPVVITDTCGLADAVRTSGSGIVVDDSEAALVKAVRRLLASPQLLEEMSQRAAQTARDVFSMPAIRSRLETVYADAVAGR